MIDAKKVHIIGIGGIGTSAAAKMFLHRGAMVTGTDMTESDIIDDLRAMNAEIHIGHDAQYIDDDTDLVLFSPAIPDTNPERAKAAEKGVRQLSYPQFLGELANRYKTIAVSGTNGKSTTTAMIAKILIDAGYDPLVFLGTKSPDLSDGNFHNGQGVWMVVEACEYREGMNNIRPKIAVITNIEEDHLDYYRDLDHIKSSFKKWIDSVHPFDGTVVLNAADNASSDFSGEHIARFDFNHRQVSEGLQSFVAKRDAEMQEEIPIQLSLPGAFNAANASAAYAAARAAGVPRDVIKSSLKTFKGTWRRFERLGSWMNAEIYSDYAHHPTAVKGSIEAFKEFFHDQKIVVIFEPHQHARTEELFDEFVQSFDDADEVVFAEIYEVAGRTESKQMSSKLLADAVQGRHSDKQIHFTENYEQLQRKLEQIITDDDIVVFMGAGTIDGFARKLI